MSQFNTFRVTKANSLSSGQAGPPTSFEPSTLAPGVEFQLVSNTCTVPPPPPIELSAVPLAELATEMVWKACLSAQAIPTPILSPLTTDLPIWGDIKPKRSISSSSFEEVRGSPKTPELYFGAIGEGRLRREDSDSSSSESSPTCSTPSTPLEFIEPMSVKERLGLQFDLEGAGNGEIDGIEAIRIHARKLSSFNRLGHGGMGSEPSTSFRTFVKQILTATLISPEDLILALYFIQKLPVEKIILPTKATGLDGLSERESAIKAAPFKLILGAIMLANKTLQDNSYRNETFAAVSGIPLKDVNALEVHLFGALDFNVNIGKIEWNTFLVGLIQSNRFNGKVSVEAFEIGRILTRLLNGNERKSGLNSMRFVDEKSQLFF